MGKQWENCDDEICGIVSNVNEDEPRRIALLCVSLSNVLTLGDIEISAMMSAQKFRTGGDCEAPHRNC